MRSERADQHIAKMDAQKTPYFKKINKIRLRIDKGVYPTGKIGKLFNKAFSLSTIDINNKKVVLDYGTGTGFLAIAAAKHGAKVVAIDKNPIAIKSAIYNAEKNNVKNKIDFRISENLSAICGQEKFDIVLAGLPWEDAIPCTSLEMAFYDEGFSMRKALAEHAHKILVNNEGIILISYSKKVQDIVPIEKFFPNFSITILLEKVINNDPHYILCLRLLS